MATDFGSVVAAPPSGRGKALILDHRAYAQKVILRGGSIPWDDLALYTNFFDQAQELLRPDAALVDLGAFVDHLLAADHSLVDAMSARSRTGFAFKTLLSDETVASRTAEFASVVTGTAKSPIVLQIPSPLRWLARTHEIVGAGAADIERAHGENMSAYLAAWMRHFSGLPVALLLLDGRRADYPDLTADDLSAYTPVINAAQHYRWAVGLRADDRVDLADGSVKGVVLPAEHWLSDEPTLPEGDFLLAELPPNAEPETVLARIAHIA
ncbi:hypothetical protein FDG2_0378 [Candidatus Protofrankia californiensis]|uniref:Uncharacterized protein n=1 Tax=Candidatus Protofrankia californiensis TaxID=1839754 RepID=A0A1C3NTK1_9ACTN|nr:hypothetical protein FDG2_0378 [Candidatus Protofrankia californiensis]